MFGNALFVSRASGTAVASSKASPHLDVRKLVGGFWAKQTQAWAQGATRRGQTCHTINCRPIMTSTGTRAPTSPIGGALGLTTTPSTALTLPCRPISHYSSSATTPFPNYESRVELCSSTAYFSHRFPLPAGTKLEAAGTNGLAGHGLKRRQLEEGNETTEISERC